MGKRAGRLTIGGVRVRVTGGAWVVGRGAWAWGVSSWLSGRITGSSASGFMLTSRPRPGPCRANLSAPDIQRTHERQRAVPLVLECSTHGHGRRHRDVRAEPLEELQPPHLVQTDDVLVGGRVIVDVQDVIALGAELVVVRREPHLLPMRLQLVNRRLAIEALLPIAHGALVDPDKHRDVGCPHGGSHQQDGLPCLGDTLLGARKPHDRFDRFQNFRRQHEGRRPGATTNTVSPRRCIDRAIRAPSPESSGPNF
jgi:hypothetical protein